MAEQNDVKKEPVVGVRLHDMVICDSSLQSQIDRLFCLEIQQAQINIEQLKRLSLCTRSSKQKAAIQAKLVSARNRIIVGIDMILEVDNA